MTSVLFICLGNICRSPMAEFIFRKLAEEKGVADKFRIASAATSDEEFGNPVYPPVRELLFRRGIDCSAKRAVCVTEQDCRDYDYLICMDEKNRRTLLHRFGLYADKISLLLEHAGLSRSVADPWYTRNFSEAESDILLGCNALLEEILNQNQESI